MVKRKYLNPPLKEVVCQLHFRDGVSEPQLEELGKHWEALYPLQKIHVQEEIHFQVDIESSNVSRNPLGKRLVCRSKDEQRLVQASAQFLAINQLAPYSGWEQCFRPVILERFKEFQQIAKLSHLDKCSLRYINQISIPEAHLEWDRWFAVPLGVPSSTPREKLDFHTRFEEGRTSELKFYTTMATVLAKERETAILLDFDLILERRFKSDDLSSILDIVHGPHSEAFEQYITDETRKLFE